ncbi:putative methyltransferase DDB_G0268948 [Lingula anatina]|uniref:Methyltransferase DDB_G0268948 n=1 Tax=Lingula anatina TaxID=7574 RepID=A0A1S3IYE0_LINAN|nr:putative methyltransferase DDB_G0268948 [Lingula anatina]|eukprot:XP_013402564.2 putative methyltransferase DDB_G0268948 [Lingula anatina]
MAHRHFEGAGHVIAYAKYRPQWTKNIVDRVITYLQEKLPAPYDQALDVGCGSGQFTHLLAPHFNHVTGIDVSDNQILQANNKNDMSNVRFKKGSGESFPVDDHSVDLVTSAQAAHWFDLDKFYAETERVLRPHGCVALLGYAVPVLDSNPHGEILSKYIRDFYGRLWKTSCWDEMRKHVDNRYPDERFACRLPLREYVRDETLSMEYDTTLEHFIGYVSSWSGYNKYMEKYPESKILEDLQENLLKTMDREATIHSELHVTFPIFMLLGRKPGS